MNKTQNWTIVDIDITKAISASNDWIAPPAILPERFCTISAPVLVMPQTEMSQVEEVFTP